MLWLEDALWLCCHLYQGHWLCCHLYQGHWLCCYLYQGHWLCCQTTAFWCCAVHCRGKYLNVPAVCSKAVVSSSISDFWFKMTTGEIGQCGENGKERGGTFFFSFYIEIDDKSAGCGTQENWSGFQDKIMNCRISAMGQFCSLEKEVLWDGIRICEWMLAAAVDRLVDKQANKWLDRKSDTAEVYNNKKMERKKSL